jgi:hypothetical protein
MKLYGAIDLHSNNNVTVLTLLTSWNYLATTLFTFDIANCRATSASVLPCPSTNRRVISALTSGILHRRLPLRNSLIGTWRFLQPLATYRSIFAFGLRARAT